MAIDFRSLMSPELRAYHDLVTLEIDRLYALPDRFLARAILQYARAAREVWPTDPDEARNRLGTQDIILLWDIVPEIAARLGEKDFSDTERQPFVRAADLPTLRSWLWNAMTSFSGHPSRRTTRKPLGSLNPWDILARDPANGNVLAFATDRLAFGSHLGNDPISRHLLEVSRSRGFEPPTDRWSPDLMEGTFRPERETRSESSSAEVIRPKFG